MDILTTIKNIFSSDEDVLKQSLSPTYTVRDLAVTNTGIKNVPTPSVIPSLKTLAEILEDIYDQIGPFTVPSAYRNSLVQSTLTSEGLPTSPTKSFHELGMAADIIPTGGLMEFWAKLLSNKDLRLRLGEIAIKPAQGSIHISLATPNTQNKVMELRSGKYVRLTEAEVSSYMGSNYLGIIAGLGAILLWLRFKK